jgi:CheY-like chemotaxis protein
MRILYVEDNPANLFLVQRVARMGNHDVITYSEGQPALDHFQEDRPDLVLMDIQLSGTMNGLDVVKALRKAGHRTPIVAVTAYAMSGDREKCIEAGCDGYLSKPLPVGELVELFKRYEPAVKAAAPPPIAAVPAVKPEDTVVPPAPVVPQAVAPETKVDGASAVPPVPAAPSPAPVEPAKVEPAPVMAAVQPPPAPETKADAPAAPSPAPVTPPAAVEPAKEPAPASLPVESEKPASPSGEGKMDAATPALETPKPAAVGGGIELPAAQGVSKESDEKISLENKQSSVSK